MLEKYLNEKREKSAIALIVPDLNFLISGGRIGAFKGGLAKLFKVKAVISLDYDGLNFYQKVIKSESLPNEVEKMLKDKIKFDPKKVKYATILRSKVQNTEFDINKIEDLLINKFKFKSITKGEVPATIQVHIGPNFIALGIQLV
jgi:fatty acid-binding protein DegV